MPKNTVQFQKGSSLHEFIEKYGSEEQCQQALYQLRWPTGYICPGCVATQQVVNSKAVRYISATNATTKAP